MVLTSSLKNVKKSEKCHFQRFRTFVFDVMVASKPFYKRLLMNKFGFTQFCLAFSKNSFNLDFLKFGKK